MATSRETGSGSNRKMVQRPLLSNTNTSELKNLLQQRLIDCGWRKRIREIIRSKLSEKGISKLSYDQLAAQIIPQARALVPDEVRKELYQRVLQSLEPDATTWSDEDD